MDKLKRKTLVAFAIILVIVLSLVAYFFVFREPQATKLVVAASTTFIPLDKPVKLTIKAVDYRGKIDTTRNDVVELSLTSVSYSKPSAQLSTKNIQLKNGIGTAYIQGEVPEVVDITVKWKKGSSQLESYKLQLFIGIGEE